MNQEENKQSKKDKSKTVNCPYCRQKTRITETDIEEHCGKCENCDLLFGIDMNQADSQ